MSDDADERRPRRAQPSWDRPLLLDGDPPLDTASWSPPLAVASYRFTEEEYVSIARRVVFKLRQEGVRFLTPESDNWIRWRYLPTCVEVAGCYVLLLQGRRAAAYVPKKAFASEGDEQAVRALLAQHTTKRLRGWR